MTDIELADEYYNSIPYRYADTEDDYSSDIKQAYLTGLKAGRPKWHNVSDGDVPPISDTFMTLSKTVLSDKGESVYYDYDSHLWYAENNGRYANVIAWCEMPQYTEE